MSSPRALGSIAMASFAVAHVVAACGGNSSLGIVAAEREGTGGDGTVLESPSDDSNAASDSNEDNATTTSSGQTNDLLPATGTDNSASGIGFDAGGIAIGAGDVQDASVGDTTDDTTPSTGATDPTTADPTRTNDTSSAADAGVGDGFTTFGSSCFAESCGDICCPEEGCVQDEIYRCNFVGECVQFNLNCN